MCQHEGSQDKRDGPVTASDNADGSPFPWHLGAFDAHCHPTDTMSSTASFARIRAPALTDRATRWQDQQLVAQVAGQLGVASSLDEGSEGSRVVAAFGWHPWFSHQIYDDTAAQPTFDLGSHGDSEEAAKRAHYAAVLQPSPTKDADWEDFVSSLPTPIALSSFLDATRGYLSAYPLALVGEIGLDKAFRLPRQWSSPSSPTAPDRDEGLTPGGREGRPLSPYRVRMPHQQAVLEAQLRLAGETGRAVSVHGVQAHGVLFESVCRCWKGHELEYVSKRKRKMDAAQPPPSDSEDDDDDEQPPRRRNVQTGGKPFPPRICLHSFSGSPEILHQWLQPTNPADIFFSFSAAVNMGGEAGRARTVEAIRQVPDDKLLVESDLHIAGEEMDRALEWMYREVCRIKGWGLEEGVSTIRKNFERFIFG
jgi:Tat protein secretion system quality control protein TatD with DNase activity